MKIASFNVESLFCRPRAMNLETWDEGRGVLTEFSRLNAILAKEVYEAADKKAIVASLSELGLSRSDDAKFARLRQNHGRLVKRSNGRLEVVAEGRGDWIGWVELETEAVNEMATRMTAQVIRDVDADILAVIEAENRIALLQFNEQLLKPLGADYRDIMLIDGNDERGIDVGILCRNGCAIGPIVSHVNDAEGGHVLFSRDCPEYMVQGSATASVLVLVNHLKSKGYGSAESSNKKRKAQAQRVREIYEQRKFDGVQNIAIVGDFNDTPESDALSPLLQEGSDLCDITQHPKFKSDGREGTYGNGAKSNKIDYLLLSPALFARVTEGGIFRKGVWGGKNGALFEHYPEMTEPIHAASDHAAIWAEIDLG